MKEKLMKVLSIIGKIILGVILVPIMILWVFSDGWSPIEHMMSFIDNLVWAFDWLKSLF